MACLTSACQQPRSDALLSQAPTQDTSRSTHICKLLVPYATVQGHLHTLPSRHQLPARKSQQCQKAPTPQGSPRGSPT